jgi:hypothetical protein
MLSSADTELCGGYITPWDRRRSVWHVGQVPIDNRTFSLHTTTYTLHQPSVRYFSMSESSSTSSKSRDGSSACRSIATRASSQDPNGMPHQPPQPPGTLEEYLHGTGAGDGASLLSSGANSQGPEPDSHRDVATIRHPVETEAAPLPPHVRQLDFGHLAGHRNMEGTPAWKAAQSLNPWGNDQRASMMGMLDAVGNSNPQSPKPNAHFLK